MKTPRNLHPAATHATTRHEKIAELLDLRKAWRAELDDTLRHSWRNHASDTVRAILQDIERDLHNLRSEPQLILTVTYWRDVSDLSEKGYTVTHEYFPGDVCILPIAVKLLSHKSRYHDDYTAAHVTLDRGGKFEPETATFYRFFQGWKQSTFNGAA